jgi:hypothetical protein
MISLVMAALSQAGREKWEIRRQPQFTLGWERSTLGHEIAKAPATEHRNSPNTMASLTFLV